MLCGYSPFRSEDPAELIKETSECNLTFHERYWRNVSAEAKSFISALVTADPETRFSAAQALEHPWLSHKPDEEHDLSGLRDNFSAKSKWRSAINGAIAMGRMKRLGSDRSSRTGSNASAASVTSSKKENDEPASNLNSDVSDDESTGWRTPTRSTHNASNNNKPEPRQSLGVRARPPADRKLSTDTGANENVLVHPPEEDHRSSSAPESEPQRGQLLKREDEAEHPGAVHALPDEEVRAHAEAATTEHKSTSSSHVEADSNFSRNEIKDRSSVDMLRMPGSFDWSESQHSDHTTSTSAAASSASGSNDEQEHYLTHLLQKLGLHWNRPHHHHHHHHQR